MSLWTDEMRESVNLAEAEVEKLNEEFRDLEKLVKNFNKSQSEADTNALVERLREYNAEYEKIKESIKDAAAAQYDYMSRLPKSLRDGKEGVDLLKESFDSLVHPIYRLSESFSTAMDTLKSKGIDFGGTIKAEIADTTSTIEQSVVQMADTTSEVISNDTVFDTFIEKTKAAEGALQELPALTEEQKAAWDAYYGSAEKAATANEDISATSKKVYNDSSANIEVYKTLIQRLDEIETKYNSGKISLDTYQKQVKVVQDRIDSLNLSTKAQDEAVAALSATTDKQVISNKAFSQASMSSRAELTSLTSVIKTSNPVLSSSLTMVRRAVPLMKNLAQGIRDGGKALKTALATSGVGLFTVAITTVISAVKSWKAAQDELNESIAKTADKIAEVLDLEDERARSKFLSGFKKRPEEGTGILERVDAIVADLNSGKISRKEAVSLMEGVLKTKYTKRIDTQYAMNPSEGSVRKDTPIMENLTKDMQDYISTYFASKTGSAYKFKLPTFDMANPKAYSYKDDLKTLNIMRSKLLAEHPSHSKEINEWYKKTDRELMSKWYERESAVGAALNSAVGSTVDRTVNLSSYDTTVEDEEIQEDMPREYISRLAHIYEMQGKEREALLENLKLQEFDYYNELIAAGWNEAEAKVEAERWKNEQIAKYDEEQRDRKIKFYSDVVKTALNSAKEITSAVRETKDAQLQASLEAGDITEEQYRRQKEDLKTWAKAELAVTTALGIAEAAYSAYKDPTLLTVEEKLIAAGIAGGSVLASGIAGWIAIDSEKISGLSSSSSGRASVSYSSPTPQQTYVLNTDSGEIVKAINGVQTVLVVDDLNRVQGRQRRVKTQSGF